MADEFGSRQRLAARLDQRLTQKLALTPQMRQSLEMLQMNILELCQQIRTELTENPLLEEESEVFTAQEEDSTPADEPPDDSLDDVMRLLLKRQTEYAPEDEDYRPPVVEHWRGDSEIVDPAVYERVLFRRENLADHLLSQLQLAKLSEEDFRVAERIVGNIDEDGFLRVSIAELAANSKVKTAKVKQILGVVQEFDPPGVGARDLKECLSLQLRSLFSEHELFTNGDPFSPKLRELASKAVEKHFDLLAAHRHPQLKRALKIGDATLKKVVELIEALEPYPGRAFDVERGTPILPDVYVVKRGGKYVAMLNDRKIPRLRVVTNYEDSLQKSELEADEREFIRQRATRAQWVLRSIAQWKETMLRVAEVIVEFESEFFDKGALFLKPLKLTDVSTRLELHETTIGRTVSNKYIDTPRGLFEMKYFFHRGLETHRGSRVSSITVKQLVKERIEKEDPGVPYNDQQICDILAGQGIIVSRRVIAKYREVLGIPPSHLRKRHDAT